MSDIPFTVNTLLGLPDREFCDQVLSAGAEQEEADSMKERVQKGLRGLQWKAVEGEVRRKAGELLNIDVLGLITSAWHDGKVMGRLEEGNKSKEGTAHIPLQEHTIQSELEPYIEIQFGSLLKKIVLNVKIEIKLKGLILKIEDSKIKAIEAGSIMGTGDITVKKVRLLQRGFGPIDLPAKVNLGSGIPLRKAG
jgi:citrate lyase gamma subunit